MKCQYLGFYSVLVVSDSWRVKAMRLLGRIIDWLKQRKNDGYRVSETRRAEQMQLQKLYTKYIYVRVAVAILK